MILDERGLWAFVLTLHPGVLLVAAVVAALASLPFAWLVKASGVKRAPLLLVTFFVGSTLVAHVALSWLADLRPASLDVVQIGGDDLKPRSGE